MYDYPLERDSVSDKRLGKKIVGHGPRWRRHFVERDGNGLGFKSTNDNGEAALVDLRLKQQGIGPRGALAVG